ncbi:MAG: hypothetical protein ACR2OB_15340, partial [Solirubrobacteraceae bacterium]
RALDRALVSTAGEGGGQRTRSSLATLTRWMPTRDHRAAVVAAKEILLTLRDPMRRTNWIGAWAVGIVSPLGFMLTQGLALGKGEALLAAFPALTAAGGINLNGFGLDGTAIWTQISSAASLRADLRGRVLGMLAMNLPCAVLAAGIFAVAGGHPGSAPLGICAGAGTLLAVLGAGAFLSVRVPMVRARSAFGVSPGVSGRSILSSATAVLLSLLGLAPGGVLVGAGLHGWSPGLYLGAPVLIAGGGAVCAAGVRIASRWVEHRQPELLQAVSPRRA